MAYFLGYQTSYCDEGTCKEMCFYLEENSFIRKTNLRLGVERCLTDCQTNEKH